MAHDTAPAPAALGGDGAPAGEPDAPGKRTTPWAWIPTVYFVQGLQYSVTIQLFAIAFFTMGVSAGDTLFWIGAIGFPWMIKPLWGPLVDRYGTKRSWTCAMQFAVGIAFVAAAGSLLLGRGSFLGMPLFLAACVAALTILAFCAATHDIACDGFYMLALDERKQAFFVGMRSAFFQAAMMFANGVLIWMAGTLQSATGLPESRTPIVAREKAPVVAPATANAAAWPPAAEESIQIMPPTLEAVAGKTTFATVRLSHPPPEGESRVVVLRLERGNQGISIPKEFERLEFSAANWRAGVDVPVVAAARLGGERNDVILAQAGNIPLSWSAVALLCAGIFLAASLWHRFVLPRPAGDAGTRDAKRPPFAVAVGWLALTVGIPFLACWGLAKGVGLLKNDVQAATVGEIRTPALQDLRELLDAGDDTAAVSVEDAWLAVEELRASSAAGDVGTLRAAVDLRGVLASSGILDDAEATAKFSDALAAAQSDPSLYGSPALRRALALATALDGGAVPIGESAMSVAVAKAADPALDGFADAGRLEALAAIERASGGRLPESRAAFDAVVAEAMATPSRLEKKGFDSLFAFGRLLLVVLVVVLVVRVPFLWRSVGAAARRASDASGIGFADVFASFFAKPGIATTLAFLLTYRLGKSQLVQVKNLFLLDARGSGGLGLSLGDVALVNSTTYLGLLTAGGLLGGFVIARAGLRRAIWPMVAFMHLPNLLYLWLGAAQPVGLLPIHVAVGIESFGHGFGFAAYLVIMMIAAQGPYKTAHYALCTGAMALGNMLPGMWAGYLQELVGYNAFFGLVMAFALPGTILIPFLKLDMTFGAK